MNARCWGIAAAFVLAGCSSSTPSPSAAPPPPTAKKPRPPPRFGPGSGPPGQAALNAAITAAKAQDLDGAIKMADKAVQQNPQLEQAYLLKGSACAMKEDVACEKASYEAGIAALPRSSALYKEMGLFLLGQGQVDASITSYEEANKLAGGKDAGIMADLAYALVYAKRSKEAVELAERAMGLDDKCYTCAMALGQAKLSERDFGGAADAYGRAAEINADDRDAKHGLAKAYFLAGKLDEAAAVYDALVNADSSDFRMRVQAAQVAMKRKSYAEAVKYLQPVADANPKEKGLLELLLSAQTKAKDRKGAKATKARLRALKGS